MCASVCFRKYREETSNVSRLLSLTLLAEAALLSWHCMEPPRSAGPGASYCSVAGEHCARQSSATFLLLVRRHLMGMQANDSDVSNFDARFTTLVCMYACLYIFKCVYVETSVYVSASQQFAGPSAAPVSLHTRLPLLMTTLCFLFSLAQCLAQGRCRLARGSSHEPNTPRSV
jgi:hypothetical protein